MDRKEEILYPFPMPYKFHKVSDVLSKLMKDYGLSAKTHEYRILKIWNKTVGDRIASHAQPLRLIREVLTVIVDSPVWMHQLTFYKEDLISKMNAGIGRDIVKDIRFKTGKVEVKGNSVITTQDSRPRTDIPVIESKVEGYLEPIKDKEVRKIVKKTITKALIRGKDKR